MTKKFVSGIKDRDPVDSIFLVKDKIAAMAKNGKPYMNLRLMDKSGEIEAKVWDNVDELGAVFDKDDFIAVRGKATVYLGKMQLVVADLKRIPESAVELADFLPMTARDIAEMERELGTVVSSITDRHLRLLMEAFLGDAGFMAGYRIAPAAKGMHHVYLGGLLEHSLAVARLVDTIAPLYSPLNRDLLIAGALLHDIGKVREMAYLRSFDYTDEGKLIGHITIGVEMIQEKVSGIAGFPAETAILLKHMILSHHGQYEYGSPKRPKTIEATILNYLDDLDAKINGIRTHIGREPDSQSRWSSYHKLYDRYYFKDATDYSQDDLDADPDPVPVPKPVENTPKPVEREKKGFHNNPFEKLNNENLDLF
ncbi:3'-5' exoribonuclease YhaM family protein [Geobacter sp. OR-1]|uniref:3'-5' exoribonuclease YhaM family protein n=1 Tax=Geobacter sp. OR-1 TaxID=1266765 RepID=UPI0005A808FE|nr:HD domain-containing protein [Geobacter sp. OR-1]